MRKSYRIIAFALCIMLILLQTKYITVKAGSVAETLGVENDHGQIAVDTGFGVYVDKISDYGAEKAKELGNTRLGTLSKVSKWGGAILGTVDTIKDAYDFATKSSTHDSTLGWLADKGLQAVSVGMGIAATVGAGAVLIAGAPVAGTVAVVTGTGFIVGKVAVDVTRASINTETVRNAEGLFTGRTKIVPAFINQDGLNVIDEEFPGLDLYPGLHREIPNPNTGIPVYKPNIYIYSSKDIYVNVKLYPARYITKSAPSYNIENGWNAKVFNGSINGNGDYLFYEALVPDKGFQLDRGFVIGPENRRSQMKILLENYGFNKKEISDFIAYWNSKLSTNETYIFYPQNNSIVNNIMPLLISPEPESIYRLWFYIEPRKNNNINSPEINKIDRSDYTVIEWGGIIK